MNSYRLFVGALFLFVNYTFFFFEKPSEFTSFSLINWSGSAPCSFEELSTVDSTSRALSVNLPFDGVGSSAYLACASQFIEINDVVARFHYVLKTSVADSPFSIRFENEIGETLIESIIPVSPSPPQIWSPLYINIPSHLVGSRARVSLLINSSFREVSEISFRDRFEFLTKVPEPYSLFKIPMQTNDLVKSVSLAGILFLMILSAIFLKDNQGILFLAILALSSGAQFLSLKPYYYFDEWHVIGRFSEIGFSGIWHLHNEHFLPLYFAWYYFATSFLGNNYPVLLFITLVLHVLHGGVIVSVLKECGVSVRASRVIAFLFSVSALHVEVMEWAFEQCIILCSIGGLLSFRYALRYIRLGKKKDFAFVLVLVSFLPLLFGNGFVWAPLLVSLLLVFVVFKLSINRKIIARLVFSLFGVMAATSIPAMLYIWNKPVVDGGSGSSAGVSSILDNYEAIISYIVVGSGLGSGLRSLGLYPNLTLSPVWEGLVKISPGVLDQLNLWIAKLEVTLEVFLGAVGLVLLLFGGLLFSGRKPAYGNFFYVKAGFIMLFFSFLLPAIGRYNLGVLQSLALRYQYQALLGVVFLMVPLVERIILLFGNSCGYSLKSALVSFLKTVVFLLLYLWLGVQSYLVLNFSYFRHLGEVHRIYVAELVDWDNRAQVLKNNTPYEGTGSLGGAFPVHLPTISLGSHPLDILRTRKQYLLDSSTSETGASSDLPKPASSTLSPEKSKKL
ncbi:MAG TPA: hypothetical protein PKA63_05905 [Oligoflexia bacterium]|nr:hypothetical protein [Oligoflexia bacterium]HMP48184.1 hypothetical protein [Oligoflexia bacterium]